MKVLLLTTHLDIGGIAVYVINLARCLKQEGVDVVVASGGGELENRLAEDGIRHVRLGIRTKSEFGISVWRSLPKLNRHVLEEGYDLVHAQTRVAQVLACLSRKFTAVPYVSTCHGFFRSDRIGRRLFPCWGSNVIAISKSVREHLKKDFSMPPGKVTMIYNGIDVDRYSRFRIGEKDEDLARGFGIDKNVFVVGTVGRLSSVKGHNFLIEAFSAAVPRQPAMRLLIVGEGPEEKALGEQVRLSGLEDKVFFTSGKNKTLESFFSVMDVFCLASVSEGLGFSLMEAMASGRPCVASDIGGLSELIDNGEDGLLVPARDPEALSGAILRLAEDGDLRKRIAKKAREKALRDFSVRYSALSTIEVYKRVMSLES
jgi:glycosyltransferase involved in cell wall biosynthesis